MKINLTKKNYIFSIKYLCMLSLFLTAYQIAMAHQTPSTIVVMDIEPAKVTMELQLPLSELELAFGNDVFKNTNGLVVRLQPQLAAYLLSHIRVTEATNKPWLVSVTDMKIEKAEQPESGPPFKEITVHLILKPCAGSGTRQFTLYYDVIMHQVINHAALVSIRNDWEMGSTGGQLLEAGVIHRDMRYNTILPLTVNLEKGSWWKGFKSMFALGMQHIKEGTDHLLFLLTLLLPAMLIVKGKTWGRFGGTKYSLVNLLSIITAFTIGHSITLLIGALGWLKLPAQPVEILIALSILISAVHAVYPLFPGREMYVAVGFGLMHGLAFASVLANLNLGAGPMALSILGFNLGIESMQLFVMILVMPWFILLSQTRWYKYVRPLAALFSGIAAIAWIEERSSGNSNIIGTAIVNLSRYAVPGIAALAVGAVTVYLLDKKTALFYFSSDNKLS